MNNKSYQTKFFLSLSFVVIIQINKLAAQHSLDSINVWIEQAKNRKINIELRKSKLQKAYLQTPQISHDSIKADRLIEIAYRYYKLKDSIQFLKINKEAEYELKKTKSDYLLGHLHWNFAIYYHRSKSDYLQAYKHYNTALKYFKKTEEIKNMGTMLYGMAQIKGYYKDYSGAEKLTIRAIKIFKSLNNNFKLYALHNHLGKLQRDIKEYDKAIEYYHKAISFYKKMPQKIQQKKYIEIYNNIANAYFEKKEYQKALTYYNKELRNKFLRKAQYARVIHNRAYCKLKMLDTIGIANDFQKALGIRMELGDKTDILYSKKHLVDYYTFRKDSVKALLLAKEVNTLSKQIKNGVDYLSTLQQLANLDKNNSKKYLDRYIAFNDSLISAERRTQNKFTRIEFETDEYIEETERLNQQQIWIIVTSIAGILILSLLYFLRVQKVKNEKLQLESEQQKANEEVYILTLQQKAKLEEEKVKERNRISEELHDGVLGKLFGTRFGLGFLNIKGDDDVLEKHQSLLNELQDIEKEIRDVSHKLNDNFNSDTVNFTFIITQLLKDKSELGGFTYEFNIDNEISWKTTNEVTKANIYRIIQEALQNILKHAKAEKVTLAFSKDDQHIIIELKDNGVGFNSKKGKKGIGIKNIKSRVKKLNGSVEFLSELTKGTSLIIKIPYKFE